MDALLKKYPPPPAAALNCPEHIGYNYAFIISNRLPFLVKFFFTSITLGKGIYSAPFGKLMNLFLLVPPTPPTPLFGNQIFNGFCKTMVCVLQKLELIFLM